MNRNDIIKALDWHAPTVEMGPQSLLRRIESLVAQAEAAEREAVLDLVDDHAKGNTDLKDAIRARGEK